MEDVCSRRDWMQQVLMGVSGFAAAGVWSRVGFGQTGAKPIAVRVVDKAGYDKVIAANKGKVVVVDCWATWCVPCRKAFPKTVELSKTYAEQGVVVVSLSFDEPVKG